jgi:pimeloyl-ACP methyl ester carboxylesterase
MSATLLSAPTETASSARYRQAERALWEHYGLTPTERFVGLERPSLRLRVLEAGSGPPVLFVAGTAATGPSWGALVRELSGFRCLMVDPPNSGLSARLDYTGREYGRVIADVLGGVLDALGLDRARVAGFSLGNVSALRLAAAHPARIDRVVLLGAGPLLTESRVPGILRAIASPLGAIMVRIPPSRRVARSFLRQMGHGASLAAGRIPAELIDWRVAFDRDTDTLRNERDMARALVRWRRGRLRPGVTFEDAELATIAQPTLLVHGTADPTGPIAVARRATGLLPRGELRVVDGAGHMPWLDDPVAVAGEVDGFLRAGSSRTARWRT